MDYGTEGVKYGVSFGTALAIAISYTTNQSILWAIIHGIFSWFYVIYFALFKEAKRRRFFYAPSTAAALRCGYRAGA